MKRSLLIFSIFLFIWQINATEISLDESPDGEELTFEMQYVPRENYDHSSDEVVIEMPHEDDLTTKILKTFILACEEVRGGITFSSKCWKPIYNIFIHPGENATYTPVYQAPILRKHRIAKMKAEKTGPENIIIETKIISREHKFNEASLYTPANKQEFLKYQILLAREKILNESWLLSCIPYLYWNIDAWTSFGPAYSPHSFCADTLIMYVRTLTNKKELQHLKNILYKEFINKAQ